MAAVNELCPVVGAQAACEVLGLPRASFYRQQRPTFGPSKKAVSARALSLTERGAVLACLHEERFQDRSPAVDLASCRVFLNSFNPYQDNSPALLRRNSRTALSRVSVN